MFWGGDKEGVESQKKRRKNKIEGEGGKKDEAEGGGRGQWQQWGGGTISNLESLEWIVCATHNTHVCCIWSRLAINMAQQICIPQCYNKTLKGWKTVIMQFPSNWNVSSRKNRLLKRSRK